MIAIYRGEDTDFAGQPPIQVKINTPFDLTGYTADILFGSVVKHFDPEEVGTKTLNLSFTAAETSGFFPGRGFASIKVYDTDGRVAILKRFVIDVRFRDYEWSPFNAIDISEMIKSFENIREAAINIPILTEDDDIKNIRNAINTLLEAAKMRTEFEQVTSRELSKIPNSTVVAFVECMKRLESLAYDSRWDDEGMDISEVRELLNNIIDVFSGTQARKIDLKVPLTSVKSLQEWAAKLTKILRTQRV